MTTYSPFELEPIFIDFKNESYNLGLDIQANQNDTLTLNFICRNNGIEEDMSKYKVELRVHNNNANVDYIQTQNENVTLSADGSVKIVCQSKNGNKLTVYNGQCNGVLRIFNTENKQKATRIITMRIVADPLETGKANICESTITKLEELDWVLNEAYNIEDEFRKAIEEAIKTKDELVKTTNEAKVINSTLAGNITTGTELNSNLVNSNKLAETNQKELDTRNTTANKNIETLTKENTTANETIINISNKIEKGTKLDNDLEDKTIIGTTLKSDLDTNIKTGTQLKTDLIELIPQVNKSKSDLDTSKRDADLSNTTLTETTDNAETKKQEIVAECKVADEKIKQMNEFGDVTEVVKDVTSLKTEVTTARDNEIDLNTRLERDKTNILNTIGDLNTLSTEVKTSIVNALNENVYNLNNIFTQSKGNYFGGQLKKLKNSLSNPLEQMVNIVFLGDSITWGLDVLNNKDRQPRDGTLSDARDGYISNSYVNNFKKYISKNYFNGSNPILSNWTNSPSGECIAEYRKDINLYPKDGFFKIKKTGTITEEESSVNSSVTKRQYSIKLADDGIFEMSFNFTGQGFKLHFSSSGDDGCSYELFVDGISKGIFKTSSGNGVSVGYNNIREHTFNFIKNKNITIKTVKTSYIGVQSLRLEAISINKRCKITNNGIIGSTSYAYNIYNLRNDAFGDGLAVSELDNYVFVQFGTNDRIVNDSYGNDVNSFKTNLSTLINNIGEEKNIILMCPNPVNDEKNSNYGFSIQDVKNTICSIANDKNLDFIDNYTIFQKNNIEDFSTDGIHPNEFGHKIISYNIENLLENSNMSKESFINMFTGDYSTVVNETITLSENINNYNKLKISFGGGFTKTWNNVVIFSDNYPNNFKDGDYVSCLFINSNFQPSCVCFNIVENNKLKIIDGVARIRRIDGGGLI